MTVVRTILVGLLSAVAVEAKKKNADQVASSKYPTLTEVLSSSAGLVTTPTVLATLLVAFAVLGWSVRKKNKAAARGVVDTFLREMLGLIIMVCCTFTPGPFLGNVNGGVGYEEWLAHCFGVIVADYTCGGPHVNPSVTTAMFIWKQVTAEEWLLRVSAQMAGGVLAFPIIQGISSFYDVTIGGPAFSLGDCEGCAGTMFDAIMNEFLASFILLMGIFIFCTTAIGKIYYIKQPLLAAVIRYCCVFYGKTGPAMNPALGTTWAFFAADQVYPSDTAHYIVYWLGSMLGASMAALTWSALDPAGPSGFLAKNKSKKE